MRYRIASMFSQFVEFFPASKYFSSKKYSISQNNNIPNVTTPTQIIAGGRRSANSRFSAGGQQNFGAWPNLQRAALPLRSHILPAGSNTAFFASARQIISFSERWPNFQQALGLFLGIFGRTSSAGKTLCGRGVTVGLITQV